MNYRKYKMITSFLTHKRSFTKEVPTGSVDYCSNIVRQHDYENFLATLLLKKDIRSAAMVIRAFNVEVARIQDQTTDAQTATFRLQFWSDTLKKIFKKDQDISNIPANPTALELYKVCTKYNISKRYLDKLIISRHSLLNTKHFHNLNDVEKYSDDSVSSIYFLILGAAGVCNVNADHAASHLGKAQGITNILRSIHVANQHKMVSLPMEVLMQHGVSQEMVLRCTDNEQMRNVIFDIASRANSHLEKARSISVPRESKEIFLSAVAVNSYLKKLQKCNFNVFDKSLHLANSMLPFNLYYHKFFNRF